jgi:hypothetical protein
MPRWLRYSTLIAISFASIAMLGLAISLFNPKLFDRYFPFLLVLNAVMPGKDYVYGKDKQGDESVNFIVQ